MATIDLHSHSLHSDGELSPQDLVRRAAQRGVRVLALTDHDSLAGLDAAAAEAALCGVQLIRGVELSTQWQGVNVHVLGLCLDTGSASLQSLIASQKQVRARRARAIAERLQALGFAGMYEAALARSESADSVGRLHFAQELQARGVVRTLQQAFDRYLGSGRKAAVPLDWVDMDAGLACLRDAAACTVLAHPLRYGLSRTRLTRLITDFAAAGGQALEVSTPVQAVGEWPWLQMQAQKHALLCSQGSDFHGPSSPWAELGAFVELPAHLLPREQMSIDDQAA